MNANSTPTDPVSPSEPILIVSQPIQRSNELIEKEFDAYAAQYEEALNEGLSVSGEGPEYFAQRRIEWTAKVLPNLDNIDSILDFGCGVGIATPLLQGFIRPGMVVGFDPSTAAIERAKRDFPGSSTRFIATTQDIHSNHFDLVYCNGVFHHILPSNRDAAFETVYRSLKPGGWFAFWENNPWNPGTRYVMSKIPFDRDAIVISPSQAQSLLKKAGFEITRLDAWFLFPRFLSWLRPFENLVHRLPLGAQYLVLVQKPN